MNPEQQSIPEPAREIEYAPSTGCLNILRLAVLFITALMICLCTYTLSFIPKLMIMINILFFSAGFFSAVIYLPRYFGKLRYLLSPGLKITKKSGFFFFKEQTIFLDKIQYTTSVSTPFNKYTGFNFLVLYAYGGIMTVMFLKNEDFNELNCEIRK